MKMLNPTIMCSTRSWISLDSRLAQFIPGIRIRSAQRMAFIGEVIFTGR